ncbi:MAG: hypothetical protein J1E40_13195 [Oscillospiraceae bacterium]|nr:hypothetical protein [Oscillospiraceae bacterium]
MEGMLAAALGLLKCGFESTVWCRFNGAFTEFEISDPSDVSALQTKLAEYSFLNSEFREERIPLRELSEKSDGKGILLYTSLFNKRLDSEIEAALVQGVTSVVITSDSSGIGNAYQVWRLNEDYSADIIQS